MFREDCGNANCAKGFDNWKGFSAYTVLNVNANSNPWLCYALNCDWFRQLVVTRWNEVKADLVKVADGESYTFGLTVGAGDEVALRKFSKK